MRPGARTGPAQERLPGRRRAWRAGRLPRHAALPLYVRDRVALDRTEQRQAAALRETIRQQEARPPARNGTRS